MRRPAPLRSTRKAPAHRAWTNAERRRSRVRRKRFTPLFPTVFSSRVPSLSLHLPALRLERLLCSFSLLTFTARALGSRPP
eukprot:4106675-Pleurochrysis_carterae.AAC.2